MNRTCEICGGAFKTAPANVRAGNGRFCSRECFQTTQRNRVARVCDTCGKGFTAAKAHVLNGQARYCSHACASSARQGPRKPGIRHRMMKAKGHPIAPSSGTAPIARVRLYDAIGAGWHPCSWCGKPVEWRVGVGVNDPEALLVDHLDHDATNDEVSNLVPSCNACNAHRRAAGDSPRIRDGELTKVMSDGRTVRVVERTCEQCGGGFVTRLIEVKKGKGRFCSRSCARRAPRIPR